MQALRDEADIVLVDSPAMLAVGDTAALAAEVDGIIFLVDMEQARRPVMQAAADQLDRLPCSMMGLVLRLAAGRRGPLPLLLSLPAVRRRQQNASTGSFGGRGAARGAEPHAQVLGRPRWQRASGV